MKQPDLQVKNLRFVVEEAIHRLPNGELRLALTDFSLSHHEMVFGLPYYISECDMPADKKLVEKQYFEELETIEEIMLETDVPIGLFDWQSPLSPAYVERVIKKNRRIYAMQVWSWYAIPWRFHGQCVYVIYCTHDWMSTPLIRQYPADCFLSSLAKETGKQYTEAERLKRSLSFWKNLGILTIGAGFLLLWGWIWGLIQMWINS